MSVEDDDDAAGVDGGPIASFRVLHDSAALRRNPESSGGHQVCLWPRLGLANILAADRHGYLGAEAEPVDDVVDPAPPEMLCARRTNRGDDAVPT
jgi:hypothetical protein